MLRIVFLVCICLLLTSCHRFINWSRETFNQGCKINTESCLREARRYLRTIKVYDQLETVGIFDALLLSKDTEKYYVNIHAQKNNLDEIDFELLLNDRLNKVEKVAVFLILIQEPKGCGLDLDKEKSFWKVKMNSAVGAYAPRLIKKIALPCEYELIFGKRFNIFKNVYLVEFDIYDSDGRNILELSDYLTLCFSSLKSKVFLRWNFKNFELIDQVSNDCVECVDKCDVCCSFAKD